MHNVSVVVPTRNRPQFLEHALQSVQRQSSDLILECIVVDDGDEATAESIERLVKNRGYTYLPNRTGRGTGGADARNTGVMAAHGEFVAFLDDDDTWHDDKLAKQIPMMIKEQIDVSYTGMFICKKKDVQRYSFRKPPSSDYYRAIMRRNFIGTTSTVVVRTEALRVIDGFDGQLPALQDYDLYIRLLRRYSLGWIPEPLVTYNAHATDAQISGSRKRFMRAVELLSQKYRDDPLFPLLRKSFTEITLLKCVRSQSFLFETLRSLLKK